MIPRLLALGFPRDCFSTFKNQCFRVLRNATQLWYNFHNSHSIFVVACSSFVEMVALLRLFVWLLVNLIMPDQTTCPRLYIPLLFVKWTLGRMPIFTRRSRARTFQIISARLSKNGTMVTFASDTSFPRHTSTS